LLRKTDSGSRDDWLSFAEADLDAVRLLAEHEVSFRVCRSKLAEALEKLLKGDLVGRGWGLLKTHDLQHLCDELASRDAETATDIQSAVDELAEAYTEDRYPGFDFDDEDEDWQGLGRLLVEVERYASSLGVRLNGKQQSP
jgi:HEPN domain-containing protein